MDSPRRATWHYAINLTRFMRSIYQLSYNKEYEKSITTKIQEGHVWTAA
jgi:hypothetical protein